MSESIVNEVKRNISVVGVSTADSPRQNGDKIDLVNGISEAIEAEYQRMEAEYQENARKDWLQFRCHAVEPQFSKASYDISNYTGELFSKIRCETEARSILREVYDEAVVGLDAKILFETAADEIMGFVKECFEEEKQKVKNCLSGSAFDELERILDVDEFRDEINEKLQSISVSELKDFCRYMNLVQYDSVNEGDEGLLSGFFNKVGKNWNFNGYAAYHALRRDFDICTSKYADKATEITRVALKKRMAMKAELLNETQNHEEGGNGHGCV